MQKLQNISTVFFKYKRKFDCFILKNRFYSQNLFNGAASKSKFNILFFGTDNFSLRSLILLDKSR